MNNPKSKLWLCKTNLENDYKNTLTFSSSDSQRNYFIGNPLDPFDYGVSTKSYTDYTYLRLEQFIKVSDFIEDIDTNNYLVLLNENKYYYYFITSMQYIDNETTRINIELDVMQTYFFDINYNNTFVEREHVNNDTVGLHTIPENVETGEYIVGSSGLVDNNIFSESGSNLNWAIVMQVVPDSDIFRSEDIINFRYNGVYSGTMYICFTDVLLISASPFLSNMNRLNKAGEIISVFMYPKSLMTYTRKQFVAGVFSGVTDYYQVDITDNALSNTITIGNKPTTLGSYTPRNKKLLTSDYSYLLMDNGTGGLKKYNFEDFSNTSIKFNLLSAIAPSGSLALAPQNYKNKAENMLESFSMSKFPMCSWANDSYTNWLTQAGVNNAFSYAKDVGGMLLGAGTFMVGAATMNPLLASSGAGMVGSSGGALVNDITENVKQKKLHELAPDELRGNASLGDMLYAHQRSTTTYYYMHVKEEYATIIDKYFDMFGYKVNILKTPSINTRLNWNYLKTKGCNFTGNIPQEYMSRIKTIFDNGITFWHNPSTMLDYSQANTIV
ncbi:MAG: hypothetical protein J6T10_28150 [Methanobrevibacter sp.]|nr:hypothetical protein [Methanobrevibacter sp.]